MHILNKKFIGRHNIFINILYKSIKLQKFKSKNIYHLYKIRLVN